MNIDQYIKKAIETCGSQKKLAKLVGQDQSVISRLLHKKNRKPITAELAIKIEKATKGVVKKEQLAPQVFEPDKIQATLFYQNTQSPLHCTTDVDKAGNLRG